MKNIDSSLKSNLLRRLEKNMKSRRIFNKKYCDLLIAITHTKIMVAYFIISDKRLKYKWRITAARHTHYFVGIIFLCFWATVCKTVRRMLSHRCLSVLSVCDVGVLWTNCWMDQDETWHGGRPRPRPHCVRWGPSSLPKSSTTPNFRSMSVVAKWLDGLRCH